jgi:hypothetical protein
MSRRLRKEIYDRAHYVEGQGDGIEMVLIRMDAIEDAVRAWDRAKRQKIRRLQERGVTKARTG